MSSTPKINVSLIVSLYHKTSHAFSCLWRYFWYEPVHKSTHLKGAQSSRAMGSLCTMLASTGTSFSHSSLASWSMVGIQLLSYVEESFSDVHNYLMPGPYALITTAVSAELGQHPSLRWNILWNFEWTTVNIFQGLQQSACYRHCNYWRNWQVSSPYSLLL